MKELVADGAEMCDKNILKRRMQHLVPHTRITDLELRDKCRQTAPP
jgi:hypothetical protein